MRRFSTIPTLVFSIVLALVVGAIFRYPLVTDDPFITYRYAQHLADGTGLVYNAGERVLSTTTPLYALVLGLVGIFLDIPTAGYWLSVVSLGACAFFVMCLVASSRGRIVGWAAGALVLCAPALLITFGLETNFYLALAMGALLLYRLGRTTAAFGVLALLTLTRNDGVLLAAILTIHYLYENRIRLRDASRAWLEWTFLRPFVVFGIVLLPWLVFSTFYYGTPFPVTLGAKIGQAQSGLWDPFAFGLVKWARDSVWLVPQFLFAVVGTAWAIRARSFLVLVGAWAIAHLAAYSLLGVAFYAWYVAPLVPALAVLAAVGIQVSAQGVGRWLPDHAASPTQVGPGAGRMRVPVVLVVVAAALLLVGLNLRAAIELGLQNPSPKVQAYERAADWIAQNTDASARIDTLEVGVIGYFNRRRTYDFVGLVDPMRLPYLRVQKFADGVRRRAAEFVIAIPPDVWLPQDAWFKNTYQPVHQIRVRDFYGNRPLVIYERGDAGRMPIETRFVNAAFEKWIELQNVELFAHEIGRGQVLPLRLNLRAQNLQPAPETWKFTIQLVGAEDRVVAQTDNYYPARLPEDGAAFADYQGLVVPTDAPPGTYELILAMYDVERNERLSLYSNDGNEVGDFVPLGKIEILE